MHSLVRLRKRVWFPTPLCSLSVTLALKHEQLGKQSRPCAQIACSLSLFPPCEQRESLRDRFRAGMLSILYLGLVFLEKGSLERTIPVIQGNPQMKKRIPQWRL